MVPEVCDHRARSLLKSGGCCALVPPSACFDLLPIEAPEYKAIFHICQLETIRP